MYCFNCGTQLPDDACFCHNCGASQPAEGAEQVPVTGPASDEALRFADFEPGAEAEPEAAPEQEGPGSEPEAQPPSATVQLTGPTGTFTWEHVTISGEFHDGVGTITIQLR